LATLGMSEDDGGVLLSPSPDERRDYKLVFIGTVLSEGVAPKSRATRNQSQT
jgi:hypothetical protein